MIPTKEKHNNLSAAAWKGHAAGKRIILEITTALTLLWGRQNTRIEGVSSPPCAISSYYTERRKMKPYTVILRIKSGVVEVACKPTNIEVVVLDEDTQELNEDGTPYIARTLYPRETP